MIYPNPGSQLFIGSANEKQAVLGHPFFTSKYLEYEIAYKAAADSLVESSPSFDSLFSCVCIYPIAFLYRQFLELYLKDILWKYYPNFEKVKTITCRKLSGSHDLYLLWKKLREYIESNCKIFQEKIDEFTLSDVLDAIEDLIAEMRVFDGQKSEKFRYPYSKDNANHFNNSFAVNLINLKERMNELANFLTHVENTFRDLASETEELNKQ